MYVYADGGSGPQVAFSNGEKLCSLQQTTEEELRLVVAIEIWDDMSADCKPVGTQKKTKKKHPLQDSHCRMNHRFLGKCRRGSCARCEDCPSNAVQT